MGKASGDQWIWEDELPRGWERCQGVNEIARMGWPVDGKGIRGSTKLRRWIAPWMGKVSGSQRNLGKMDDLEKNKSDKSQRGAWKWMIWRRVSLTKVNGIHEKGWLRLRKLAWKSLKQELEDDSVCGSGVPGQPNLWRRAGNQENNSRIYIRTMPTNYWHSNQQNEKIAGHLLRKTEKNPAIFIYRNIIYTKISWFDAPGEFF